MKIEGLEQQRKILDDKIKKIRRTEAKKGLYKDGKEFIGSCYRFRNGIPSENRHWYIYAQVKGVELIESSVYMVLDQYELTDNDSIIIKLNEKHLESYKPMHCWEWITSKSFEEKKLIILNKFGERER